MVGDKWQVECLRCGTTYDLRVEKCPNCGSEWGPETIRPVSDNVRRILEGEWVTKVDVEEKYPWRAEELTVLFAFLAFVTASVYGILGLVAGGGVWVWVAGGVGLVLLVVTVLTLRAKSGHRFLRWVLEMKLTPRKLTKGEWK